MASWNLDYSSSKLDLITPINIYKSLTDIRTQQEDRKKARDKQAKIDRLKQSYTKTDPKTGQRYTDEEGLAKAWTSEVDFEEGMKFQSHLNQRKIRKAEFERKQVENQQKDDLFARTQGKETRGRLGRMAKFVLSKEDPVTAYNEFRSAAKKDPTLKLPESMPEKFDPSVIPTLQRFAGMYDIEQAQGGRVSPPKANVFIDDKGKAWQLPTTAGETQAQAYEFPGGEVRPKFQKPIEVDVEGYKQFRDPYNPNKIISVSGKTGKQVIDEENLVLKQQEAEAKANTAKANKIKNYRGIIKDQMANESTVADINRFVSKAEELAKDPRLKYVTGAYKTASDVPAPVLKFFGAEEILDTQSKLTELSDIGLMNQLDKLKSQSSTGASGFGSLSGGEKRSIENAFSTLNNTKETPKRKREVLLEVSKIMRNYLGRVNKYREKMEAEIKRIDPTIIQQSDTKEPVKKGKWTKRN